MNTHGCLGRRRPPHSQAAAVKHEPVFRDLVERGRGILLDCKGDVADALGCARARFKDDERGTHGGEVGEERLKVGGGDGVWEVGDEKRGAEMRAKRSAGREDVSRTSVHYRGKE